MNIKGSPFSVKDEIHPFSDWVVLEMFGIFHCHLDFSSSCFPLNLFSPNLVEIVCVVSTESGSRWGERGGYKVLNGKTLLCSENAFVVDIFLLLSTRTTLEWKIIKVVG